MKHYIDTLANTKEIVQAIATLNNKTGIKISVIYGKLTLNSRLWLHSYMQGEIAEMMKRYPDSKHSSGIRYQFDTLREYIKETV